MMPDNNQNIEQAASLPPVQLGQAPGLPAAPLTSAPPTQQVSHNEPPAKAAVLHQAKGLIEQYKNSPYQLDTLMQQLKTQYIADQYNVTISSGQK